MKTLLLFLLLATTGRVLKAETDDADFPLGPTRIVHDFVSWCRVDNVKFIFERTTLSEIVRTLGGKIQRDGGLGAADFSYSVDCTDGANFIRFLSDSDMGGNRHDLEGVLIRPLKNTAEAAALPLLRARVEFPFGNSAITISALKKKLGEAVRQKKGFYFEYSGHRSIINFAGQTIPFDVTVTLKASENKGADLTLVLWHVTSG